MNSLIWCAFEESAFSEKRSLQIHALANLLNTEIVILTTSYNENHKQFFQNSRVIVNDELSEHLHSPESFSFHLCKLIEDESFCALIAPDAPHWNRILSLFSASMHLPHISRMLTRCLPDCGRIICAGRVLEKCAIPTSSFTATLVQDEVPALNTTWSIQPLRYLDTALDGDKGWFFLPKIIFEPLISEGISLDSASIVFAGGRGLGSKANFDRLAQCAKKYHVGLAASRLAVDLGWCRNDLQVGQTGKSIAPDLYVTFGISGAIQHLAGMKNAKKIMAINTDKDAPIFKYADYGVVADVNEILDGLLQ